MMTGATSGTGTAYPSGARELTPGFLWCSCCWICGFLCGVCSGTKHVSWPPFFMVFVLLDLWFSVWCLFWYKARELTPVFYGVCVAGSVVFCVVFVLVQSTWVDPRFLWCSCCWICGFLCGVCSGTKHHHKKPEVNSRALYQNKHHTENHRSSNTNTIKNRGSTHVLCTRTNTTPCCWICGFLCGVCSGTKHVRWPMF
jgi:hypothetical protein